MSNNYERLDNLLDFDVTKKPSLTQELFGEIVKDLKDVRYETAKAAAREQITKAIELREKMYRVEKEFEAQKNKFNKELGKLLNSIESRLEGRESSAPEQNDESKENSE